jgi:hypothetical protein
MDPFFVQCARAIFTRPLLIRGEDGFSGSRPADVGIVLRVIVLALFGVLPEQAHHFRQPFLRRTERRAVLATRVIAGFARIQPVLHRTREQAVGDIPDVGIFVGLRHAVSQLDRPPRCFVEYRFSFPFVFSHVCKHLRVNMGPF